MFLFNDEDTSVVLVDVLAIFHDKANTAHLLSLCFFPSFPHKGNASTIRELLRLHSYS